MNCNYFGVKNGTLESVTNIVETTAIEAFLNELILINSKLTDCVSGINKFDNLDVLINNNEKIATK